MSGPVPKPASERRRRNIVPPSRAERRLPVRGRTDLAPMPPVPLGAAGMRWWNWAWSTPQATTWSHEGFNEDLVKRAELEDLWESGANMLVDPLKILTLMLRIDADFGLNPKSAMQLHYTFDEAEPVAEGDDAPAGVTDIRNRIKGLG